MHPLKGGTSDPNGIIQVYILRMFIFATRWRANPKFNFKYKIPFTASVCCPKTVGIDSVGIL